MALPFALVILFILILILMYYWNEKQFWTRRGVPGPDGLLFLGNYLQLMHPNIVSVLKIRDWTTKYGKIYGIQEGTRKLLITSDLDMLQELFIKKFDYFYGRKNFPISREIDRDPTIHLFESRGLRWKRLRTISAPSFSANGLKKIRGKVEESALELVRQLEAVEEGGPVNIHSYYQEFTMDAISKIAMGQKESTFFGNYRTDCVKQLFGRDFRHPLFILASIVPGIHAHIRSLFDIIAQLTGGPGAKLYNGIYAAVDGRIAERERLARLGEELPEPQDFIDLFLDARSEDENLTNGGAVQFSKTDIKVSRHLTREEIVAQCFVFLLAGFDTTANSLAYTTWLLARHPEKQKRLQEEIDEICGHEEDEISYETLGRLKYLECCMKETLRMFPLASFASSRECNKTTTLGDHLTEKGTFVMADVWTIHYDKTIWGEDADQFVPERWEKGETRHTMAWFPFGAGPRLCIGMRLAYMEEKLALCHILRKYDILAGEKTEKELKLRGSSTVSPEAVTVYLRRRD